MSSIDMHFVTLCLASLGAALVGVLAPPTPGKLQLGESMVFVGGLALGLLLHHDWLTRLSLATLFPGVYYTFSGWQDLAKLPKQACASAFLGASWFLLQTTQNWDGLWLGIALGLGGPHFALWVTRHTNRTVGLALVIAATIFQLTRIPILLAS